MYKRILVPVDGSDTSKRALQAALQLARESGGQVRLLHVLDDLAYLSGYEYVGDVLKIAHEYAGKVVAEAQAVAASTGVPAEARLLEAPGKRLGDVVADEARAWGADLVVVGTHGRRGLGRALLGSGAEQVIRMAPVPVLSVRSSETSD